MATGASDGGRGSVATAREVCGPRYKGTGAQLEHHTAGMAAAAALCLMAVMAGCASLPQGQPWGNRWDNGWDNGWDNQWDAPPWWMNDPTPLPPQQGRPRPTAPPPTTTTLRPTTPSPVDSFGRVPGCDCPAPPQYNPVCGSDGNTYNNPQLLECANRCGHRVTISFVGLCVAGK